MRLNPFKFSFLAIVLSCGLTSCDEVKKLLPTPPSVTQKIEAPAEETAAEATLDDPNIYAPEDPIPVATPVETFELNKSSLVSILCYHDFHESTMRNDMTISAEAFRAQLQFLKDANIPVIPMSDVVAWKQGKKNLPDEAVVISMDDGWLGVYQVAFPILKEFGYPFTIYLYKNYLNSGGRTLSLDQLREMMANGAELGSHSVSHQALASRKGRTPEQHMTWVRMELEESKRFLESTFGVPMQTFAYPYGSKNDDIAKLAEDVGYEMSVTVNPQKTTWDTGNQVVPRFVMLRDSWANFKIATSFRGMGAGMADSKILKNDATDEQGNKLITLSPSPESTIADRLPMVSVDLSKLGDLVPDSFQMRVSGLGVVPAVFDPQTQILSYQFNQRLRLGSCTVSVKFKRTSSDKDDYLSWDFKLKHEAAYQPQALFNVPSGDEKPQPALPPAAKTKG